MHQDSQFLKVSVCLLFFFQTEYFCLLKDDSKYQVPLLDFTQFSDKQQQQQQQQLKANELSNKNAKIKYHQKVDDNQLKEKLKFVLMFNLLVVENLCFYYFSTSDKKDKKVEVINSMIGKDSNNNRKSTNNRNY